jgi:hypothetical protein
MPSQFAHHASANFPPPFETTAPRIMGGCRALTISEPNSGVRSFVQ